MRFNKSQVEEFKARAVIKGRRGAARKAFVGFIFGSIVGVAGVIGFQKYHGAQFVSELKSSIFH